MQKFSGGYMNKIISAAAIFCAAVLCGCGQNALSEKEYGILMQKYLSGEFEESFDEKLSSGQKEKILREAAQIYKADYSSLVEYMRKNHPDTYSRIF